MRRVQTNANAKLSKKIRAVDYHNDETVGGGGKHVRA
jgi:hypothetical protein